MAEAFFGVLATSASVFIGILTALLTSDFAHLIQQRDKLKHRRNQANARIDSLRDANEELSDNLQKFAEGSKREAEEIYQDFKQGAELNIIDTAILEAFEKGNSGNTTEYRSLLKYQTINRMIDNRAEIDSLEIEKQEIDSTLDSLEISEIRNSLYTNVAASVLSILIPLTAYFNLLTDWVATPFGDNLEIAAIFVFWSVGLILVFGRLWRRIRSVRNVR